ncbi:MotA/TolQ/ExbB proton channel family protein [Desulfomonile tiedjei]|uniref:Biopolymer transport protein n=1 Tax=Desulfomonile tiedjei (strain ATCC 49306 / DSM 6799 / DCB-1) TaxID=706587 RepID=I4C1K8_DESTA|nr:MotA/TolQ/ExbB proton channel family protein [Desulfomonile tiedjei]AFM23449.1 biopolymer transport protein [Desulfomonile tiedjei DSM 6799]
MDLVGLFHRGGIAMYPILLCSVAAVTVFLERLWSLRHNKLIPNGFVRNFREHIKQGRPEDAAALCDAHPNSPLSRIARAGLSHHDQGGDMIRFMVSEIGEQEAVELERYQSILGTVAYISPLLGLFGTVSGMIKAFDVISKHTVVDPPLLAAGISEALITTFAGLAVAIPVVVMDRYVQSRSEHISLELEKKAVAITEALIKQQPDSPSLRVLTPSRT